jgi:TolA-binding protein
MPRNETAPERRASIAATAIVLAIIAACGLPRPAAAQRPSRQRDSKADADAYAALQLLRRAQELLDSGEHDRGTKILETILEQYPADPIRFKARLALGKHALSRSEQQEAIGHLRALRNLEQPGVELEGEAKDMFLESLYLQGIAFFQTRQYAAAFPLLRRITNDFPNTVWANQSYYYIGMCHFAQGNWNKAIESLGLVGTFVDTKSGSMERAEAGRRFYVKIRDTDLPVLEKLGADVKVTVSTASGDSETVSLVPLPGDENTSIGSVATALGVAVPGDEVLQVVGGDTIRTSYVDGNTVEGVKDVHRSRDVALVSTATVKFTRGDFESQAVAAFLGQPSFVLLTDADLDTSAAADQASVRIVSRFKDEAQDESMAGVDVEKILRSEEESWRIRDEVTLPLVELPSPAAQAEAGEKTADKTGDKPAGQAAAKPGAETAPGVVRTGRFGGVFELAPFQEDEAIDKADAKLTAALGDEIVVSYVDQAHIGGTDNPRTVTSVTVVSGEIDNQPRAVQYEVTDPVVAAKKNLVEATAFLELARIFKAMGLAKGAKEKVGEGIGRVDPIIRQSGAIPSSLVEEAFRTKWDLLIAADDLKGAIDTCEMFNRLYPESPFVDRALMQIGRIKEEKKLPAEAILIYQRILGLPASQIKAEAQFRIAQATEKSGTLEQAIPQYTACAERYPDSPYAGESLGKLVDYHIEQKDNAAASELLEQVFQDYPDAQFLDSMLLKWVMVAYRAGNFQQAFDKCSQLLFEYPESSYAARARQILPKIEQRLKPAGDAAAQ